MNLSFVKNGSKVFSKLAIFLFLDNKTTDVSSNVTKIAELPYLPVSLPPISINTSSLNAKSRYMNDFHEIKVLGKGSFGLVTLCQNRIDGRLYALKRIALSHQSQDLHKILRVFIFYFKVTYCFRK